jgi:hypothetical protein
MHCIVYSAPIAEMPETIYQGLAGLGWPLFILVLSLGMQPWFLFHYSHSFRRPKSKLSYGSTLEAPLCLFTCKIRICGFSLHGWNRSRAKRAPLIAGNPEPTHIPVCTMDQQWFVRVLVFRWELLLPVVHDLVFTVMNVCLENVYHYHWAL